MTTLAVVGLASPAAAQASSTTTVEASPSTATTSQPVELSAQVTCAGDPSGGLGMTFFDGANLLTTVPVAADGSATYATSFGSTGTHTITAAYNGNGNCNASSATTTVQVTAVPTPPGGLNLLGINLINFRVGDDYTIYNIIGNKNIGNKVIGNKVIGNKVIGNKVEAH